MMSSLNLLLKFIVPVLLVYSCQPKHNNETTGEFQRNKEAREDSIKLADAYKKQSLIEKSIRASIETEPISTDPHEDAADDPAIWYNDDSPDKSLIFGTNKKSGIYSYNLEGKTAGYYEIGLINNIDIRNDVKIGNQHLDVLGGSNRSDNSIILYLIDSLGNLSSLIPNNFRIDTTDIDEVYGFTLYKDMHDQVRAIVNGKNGKINQYILITEDDQTFNLKFLNSWQLNTQPEGMVADDDLAYLYVGEEEKGIWKISLSDPGIAPWLIHDSQKENNNQIEYDIEGLALYKTSKNKGFLIASIQGNFTYAVFDRQENTYLGSFKISETKFIDAVEETDGLEISSADFRDPFNFGILVVQDGFNFDDSLMVGQNFKIIALEEVFDLVEMFRGKADIL